MAPLMYGISVFSCMSSALSTPGGAGLGTLGLSPSKAEAMAREAGFTRFRKLPVDHAVNAFYEVRPYESPTCDTAAVAATEPARGSRTAAVMRRRVRAACDSPASDTPVAGRDDLRSVTLG